MAEKRKKKREKTKERGERKECKISEGIGAMGYGYIVRSIHLCY